MAGSAHRWSRITLLSTLATSAVLILVPLYATQSCETVAGGAEICTTDRKTGISCCLDNFWGDFPNINGIKTVIGTPLTKICERQLAGCAGNT